MNMLKETAMGLTFTLAVGGIILSLIPERINRKALTVLTALAVLCALTVPLSCGKAELPSFSENAASRDTSHYEEEIMLHLVNQAERAARLSAEDVLVSLGIDDYEIYPDVISDGTVINLTGIRIYLNSVYSGRRDEVINAVSSALGVPAEVKMKDE